MTKDTLITQVEALRTMGVTVYDLSRRAAEISAKFPAESLSVGYHGLRRGRKTLSISRLHALMAACESFASEDPEALKARMSQAKRGRFASSLRLAHSEHIKRSRQRAEQMVAILSSCQGLLLELRGEFKLSPATIARGIWGEPRNTNELSRWTSTLSRVRIGAWRRPQKTAEGYDGGWRLGFEKASRLLADLERFRAGLTPESALELSRFGPRRRARLDAAMLALVNAGWTITDVARIFQHESGKPIEMTIAVLSGRVEPGLKRGLALLELCERLAVAI